MPEISDVIIIGSGPAGVHAALPLVEAGLQVTMIDGGYEAPRILREGVSKNFEDIRKEDGEQHKLFLGEDYSGIPVGGLEGGLGGGMTSGNRSYVLKGAQEHLPLSIENGIAIQSLAQGGLGAVWGATCAYMLPGDLRAMGLPVEEMDKAYAEITNIIGVSGPLSVYGTQPAIVTDHHTSNVLAKASRKSEKLQRMNVKIIQPHAAILTQDKGNRKASALTDMEYYQDPDESVYRPQFTLEELRTTSNFHYVGGVVVQRMEETAEGVVVFGHGTDDASTVRRWSGKKVIVAAGAINTARILLRSFDLFDTPVPFVAKPHVLAACIDTSSLGKTGSKERSSLCQLVYIDEHRNSYGYASGCAQMYSYRSLLLFRLLGNVPLPTPEGLGLLAAYAPSLIVADIRFPGLPEEGQHLTLVKHDGRRDSIAIICKNGDEQAHKQSVKRIKKAMRATGLLPVKTMNMLAASTSHYAGTIPVEGGPSAPLMVTSDGQLTRAQHIYVADAAMFTSLPALPHTLTIMANARRIAQKLATASF